MFYSVNTDKRGMIVACLQCKRLVESFPHTCYPDPNTNTDNPLVFACLSQQKDVPINYLGDLGDLDKVQKHIVRY